MAFDAFLKIDGIDGESTSQGHEKWIELLSFSWGTATAVAPIDAGGGSGAGRTSPQAFSFMKVTDSASPTIFLKLCQGYHFAKVSVACDLANRGDAAVAGQGDFIKIDFFDVIFSSYNEGGNTGTDLRPLESISFNFVKIVFEAAAFMPDGTLGASTTGGFNFQTNRLLAPPTTLDSPTS